MTSIRSAIANLELASIYLTEAGNSADISMVDVVDSCRREVQLIEVMYIRIHTRALHGTGAGLSLSKLTGVRHNFENFNIAKA